MSTWKINKISQLLMFAAKRWFRRHLSQHPPHFYAICAFPAGSGLRFAKGSSIIGDGCAESIHPLAGPQTRRIFKGLRQ
ncbi:hypothetical protein IBT47_21405 [Erwinia sp. S43]|uniref:hypothetical protein n=1 Tax=Erwinia sp. S43 TaxID=2769339 RepID=UPI0019091024|nr:hypothetical protein [Erwinia sp. S43]MBK0034848.1 hypothetical protein [Erwinia sp. S43]